MSRQDNAGIVPESKRDESADLEPQANPIANNMPGREVQLDIAVENNEPQPDAAPIAPGWAGAPILRMEAEARENAANRRRFHTVLKRLQGVAFITVFGCVVGFRHPIMDAVNSGASPFFADANIGHPSIITEFFANNVGTVVEVLLAVVAPIAAENVIRIPGVAMARRGWDRTLGGSAVFRALGYSPSQRAVVVPVDDIEIPVVPFEVQDAAVEMPNRVVNIVRNEPEPANAPQQDQGAAIAEETPDLISLPVEIGEAPSFVPQNSDQDPQQLSAVLNQGRGPN